MECTVYNHIDNIEYLYSIINVIKSDWYGTSHLNILVLIATCLNTFSPCPSIHI